MNILIPDIDNQNSVLQRLIESDRQRFSVDEIIKLKELTDKHRQPVAQYTPMTDGTTLPLATLHSRIPAATFEKCIQTQTRELPAADPSDRSAAARCSSTNKANAIKTEADDSSRSRPLEAKGIHQSAHRRGQQSILLPLGSWPMRSTTSRTVSSKASSVARRTLPNPPGLGSFRGGTGGPCGLAAGVGVTGAMFCKMPLLLPLERGVLQ